MTKYEVDYTELAEPEKSKKALADITWYLGGQEEFDELHAKLVEHAKKENRPTSPNVFYFIGIQGYPAVVWADLINAEAGVSNASRG